VLKGFGMIMGSPSADHVMVISAEVGGFRCWGVGGDDVNMCVGTVGA